MVVHGRSRADDYRTRWRKDTALLFCGLEHQAKFSNQRRCIVASGWVRPFLLSPRSRRAERAVLVVSARALLPQLSTFDDEPLQDDC